MMYMFTYMHLLIATSSFPFSLFLSLPLQVSTGTGIISYFVNLFIAVPEAFILGNGEYHVEQGSNINLVCVIEKVCIFNYFT